MPSKDLNKATAWKFIILVGVVSLFSDMTHEGTRTSFGCHEAMDQTAAMIGPLIVTGVLYLKGDYRAAFAVLLVSAIQSVLVLVSASFIYPRPQHLEVSVPKLETEGLPRRPFWLYAAALILGRLFDRLGVAVLVGATIISAAFAPLVFLGGAILRP